MLEEDTLNLVPRVYDDDISRCMPGIRDFASVKEYEPSFQGKTVTSMQLE
jgi:hypothetical protein